MEELKENLILVPKESAQIYTPGRHLIFTKDPKDLTKGYSEEDILIKLVCPPKLSINMQDIWDARFKRDFPNGVKRAGEFVGMQKPLSTKDKLNLSIFKSGYLDWKLTLPRNDEYDSKLEPNYMRPYLNIHHAPITVDGFLIYVSRGNQRASWDNSVLCTHSWGTDIDKDNVCKKLLMNLENLKGTYLFDEAKRGVIREINPFEDSKNPSILNKVLDEIVNAENVETDALTCLTLHIRPLDVGYHLCFTTKINKEAGKIIEERKKYPMVGRISDYHFVKFAEQSMIEFFDIYKNNLATTVEPTIIMACVQKFGEDFLKKLPYETKVQKSL